MNDDNIILDTARRFWDDSENVEPYKKHRNIDKESILQLIFELKKERKWFPDLPKEGDKSNLLSKWINELIEVANEYERNFDKMMEHYELFEIQSEELIQIERKLNRKDVNLRRKLGIDIGYLFNESKSPYEKYNPWSE